jgi:ABC-type uncharacterized transport system involved in gliding motility auxiliary subunit
MLMLVAAVVLLFTWLILTFVVPVGLGIVHVLLALGVVMFIRWWALRDEPPPGGAAP